MPTISPKPTIAKKPVTPKKVAPKRTKALSPKSTINDQPSISKLDSRVFNHSVSESLITQVLHVYRDNLHQNTSKAKTRGELTRTTKKMYKQKGTGNARHGSKMSPTFVGGGVAFGPTGVKPNNLKVNRKMKAAALAGLLTLYSKDNNVELFTAPELKLPNAKSVKPLLIRENTLLVTFKETPGFLASVRNLDNVTLVESAKLNAMDIAGSKFVSLTTSAHDAIVSRLLPLLKPLKLPKLPNS